MSRGGRKAIIVRDRPDLSLSRQCRLLSIARSSVYYAAKGESPANLALMRRIDELFLKYPFYGSRQMARQLRREGIHAGRHRVWTHPGKVEAPYTVCIASASNLTGLVKSSVECRRTGL